MPQLVIGIRQVTGYVGGSAGDASPALNGGIAQIVSASTEAVQEDATAGY